MSDFFVFRKEYFIFVLKKVTKLQSWQQLFGAQSQGQYAQLILKLLWQKYKVVATIASL